MTHSCLVGMDWLAQAPCVGVDVDVFYPGRRRALEICANCPVWAECLRWAAKSGDSWRHGVYGGLLASERHWIRNGRLVPDLEAALALAEAKPHPEEEAA